MGGVWNLDEPRAPERDAGSNRAPCVSGGTRGAARVFLRGPPRPHAGAAGHPQSCKYSCVHATAADSNETETFSRQGSPPLIVSAAWTQKANVPH